jgi:hypothetical protein
MKKIIAGFVMLACLAASPALAREAQDDDIPCLDLSPESQDTYIGDSQTIAATLVRCEDGTTVPTSSDLSIDFEARSDGDGNTPETPDMTCLIPPDASQCTVQYAGSNSGEVLGWIDSDTDDATVEADTAEQSETTGDQPEPDATDAVYSWWVSNECEVGMNGCERPDATIHRVHTSVTIRYHLSLEAFGGTVVSSRRRCEAERKVLLKRWSRNATVAKDFSNRRGLWQTDELPRHQGRFYAVITKTHYEQGDGDLVICSPDRSRTVDV